MTDTAIRSALPADTGRIKEIAVAAGMFTEEEVSFFDEMFDGYFDRSLEGHEWLVAETADGIVAAAQYAPEPFSDRLWNLYFLAVAPAAQGSGLGRALVAHVESDLRSKGETEARVLLVETSSTDQYAKTRDFYPTLGFVEEATIRDFYGPEDHKVIFWKPLT